MVSVRVPHASQRRRVVGHRLGRPATFRLCRLRVPGRLVRVRLCSTTKLSTHFVMLEWQGNLTARRFPTGLVVRLRVSNDDDFSFRFANVRAIEARTVPTRPVTVPALRTPWETPGRRTSRLVSVSLASRLGTIIISVRAFLSFRLRRAASDSPYKPVSNASPRRRLKNRRRGAARDSVNTSNAPRFTPHYRVPRCSLRVSHIRVLRPGAGVARRAFCVPGENN